MSELGWSAAVAAAVAAVAAAVAAVAAVVAVAEGSTLVAADSITVAAAVLVEANLLGGQVGAVAQVVAGQEDIQEVRGNVLSVQARVQAPAGGSHKKEANLTVRVHHGRVMHNRGRCHLSAGPILDNHPYNLYT